MSPPDIVQKPWNYCNVLRDDSMSYLPASLCSAQTSGDYPGSSPGQAKNEAAPRLGHPASLYLLRPWSRVRLCTRPLSAPALGVRRD